MGMSIEEIRYRLQAMVTMCTFQDAVGHDLSYKEIKLYNQAKDEAISIMRKYQKIQEIYDNWNVDFGVETHRAMIKIGEVLNGNIAYENGEVTDGGRFHAEMRPRM